jgi:PilZ domain
MSEPDARIEDAAPRRQDPPLAEHRDTARTLLRDIEGVMSWRVDEREVTCKITVLNISGGAAAIVADGAPRVGHQVRLSLPSEPPKEEPIEGRVIETWSDPSGKCVIYVRFLRWVPLGPYIAARRERRLWERHPVRESAASLTWLEGETEKSIRGDLLNICVGGAAFIGDVLPPPGVSIWLQLEARAHRGVGIDAIEGRLLMSSFDPTGRKVAHIEFVDPCPSDFFNLAVEGPG